MKVNMVNYNNQQIRSNPSPYPARGNYISADNPSQPLLQQKHHNYVLLTIIIIAAIITTIIFISYSDIWKIGISQFNDGEELPPALPSENAPEQFAADSGSEAPPPLPNFT